MGGGKGGEMRGSHGAGAAAEGFRLEAMSASTAARRRLAVGGTTALQQEETLFLVCWHGCENA